MVGYRDGLREFIGGRRSLARIRWLVAFGRALDALALTVLLAIVVRVTLMGDTPTPPGLVGGVCGLAFFQLSRMFRREGAVGRRARGIAFIRDVVLAVASTTGLFALDALVFP